MEQSDMQTMQAQLRKLNQSLNEALDLTRQLAEAVDRNDQVSVRMVLSMRREPLLNAARWRESLRERTEEYPPEEARRLRELLTGSPAQTEHEQVIAYQVAANQRVVEQIRRIDQALNRRLAQDKSFYNKQTT